MGKPTTYNEPTILWRYRHLDGRIAQAVIVPRMGANASALWFIAGELQCSVEFRTWRAALEWLGDVEESLAVSGWTWWERPQTRIRTSH